MREKHPIDDRFKEALYHAEAEPPAALRNAVMAHLDAAAGPRPVGGLWPTALLVVGLVGAGAAIWSWNKLGTSDVQQPANQHQGPTTALTDNANISGANNGAETGLGASASAPLSIMTQGTSNPGNDDEHIVNEHATTLGMNNDGQGHEQQANGTAANRSSTSPKTNYKSSGSSVSRPASSTDLGEGATTGKGANSTMAGPLLIGGMDMGQATVAPNTGATDNSLTTGGGRSSNIGSSATSASFLSPLPIALSGPGIGSPELPNSPPLYVLPDGVWWIGAYVGLGTVQGEWKGSDVESLDLAEDWQSTGQVGVQMGREWKSGWSVSTGLGVSTVRSRFDINTTGPSSSFLDVDTTWAEFTHTTSGVPLYTWVIDSTLVNSPGALSRVDSRNRYAAVQIPLTLHWHGDLRRFRLGAFGGVMAWVPTKREGLTLAQPSLDGNPSTIALQDPQVNDRFSAQLHGQAGLSVGYFITEHFSAFMEPLISTPILSFGGGETPWLTRPTIQLRIQHELRYRQH